MAKPKTPLLSFGARGAIAKSVTFSKWKGVHVAKEYATPSNPKTPAQQADRTAFSQAVQLTQQAFLDPNVKQGWNNLAGTQGNRQSGFNLAVSAVKAAIVG